MLLFFCGEDTVAARKGWRDKVDNLKGQGEVVPVAAKNATELAGVIQKNSGLFQEKIIFVCQNVLAIKKGDIILKEIESNDGVIVVDLEEKAKAAAIRKKFVRSDVREYKVSASIWQLLDSFSPIGIEKWVERYYALLEKEDATFIHIMLQRRVKELVSMAEGVFEVKNPWMAGKIKTQAQYWDKQQLLKLYGNLHMVERRSRTGQSAGELEHNIATAILLSAK